MSGDAGWMFLLFLPAQLSENNSRVPRPAVYSIYTLSVSSLLPTNWVWYSKGPIPSPMNEYFACVVCICTTCVTGAWGGLGRSLGTGVADCCDTVLVLGIKPGPLKEQLVLFTTEPFLQLQEAIFGTM